MKTKTAMMTALVLFAANAFGAPVSSTISAFRLHQIHTETLPILTSTAGESLKDFLLNEVRPALRGYSDQSKLEGCGELAFNPATKQYSVMLFSSQSHLACVIDPSKVEAGFTAMNVTIHSHGGDGQFSMNRSDRVFTNESLNPNTVMVYGENVEHFSETDYQGGAGFLATPTTVRFQNGTAGSECDVKTPACAATL